ncbi:MAG TPA: redoxin domain-containing protein [Dehalococcoidales bacterium]|nr:redoxin domain-containing protein [Dehalococcoidales bacterium]
MIAVGVRAPDFSLKDQNGKIVKLSALKGKKVLLSFKPLAWTSICHDQIRLLEENHLNFDELNTIPLGLGVDSVPSNKAWAKSMNIENTRLLSDFWPHGEIARKYGAFRENDGFSERANIIIDEGQTVVFAKVYPTSELPDFAEIFKFLGK